MSGHNGCIKNKNKPNQNNQLLELNTCPTVFSISPIKFLENKILNDKISSNDYIQNSINYLPLTNVLKPQSLSNENKGNLYRYSQIRRKIPKNKILNDKEQITTEDWQSLQCSPSISMETNDFNRKINNIKILPNEMIKNLASTTLSVHFFKDYG